MHAEIAELKGGASSTEALAISSSEAKGNGDAASPRADSAVASPG